MSGLFIVFEGIDGSGKSTQARLLAEWFRERGYNVLLTKEPTDTSLGKFIREVVVRGSLIDGSKLSYEAEALLFAADRAEHVRKVIKPALDEGKVVICDRYFYSSLAYQWARGLDLEWLMKINEFAIRPNLAILLDLPTRESLKRIRARANISEFDKLLDLQKKVRQNYLKLAEMFPEMKIINAMNSIEDVHRDIVALVEHELL
ncbi:dTMP kinase [Thermococcus chitonophagus]|uniref:Probable thymidylate kinase n=1 Tax=Thermococcus chitonophagus TaxID=54262 RepID=A0A170STY0_9EURY|nr:dTMP kinase [Thermococcus chitonophagus]ASJ16302.1 dTMP kinase [Thermococcus chitonophagus]CUX78711.1 Thymidylate kinase [Thermococcus chitonophagus]